MSYTYRFYRLDGAGHLRSAEWFEANGDDDATALIDARHPNAPYEIWLGNRLVAKLSPERRYA